MMSKPDRAIMQNELGTPAEDRRNLPQRLPLPSPINNLVAAKPLDLTPLDGTNARWATLTSNPRVAELFVQIVKYVLNPNYLHGPPGHTFDDAVKYLVSRFFEQEDLASRPSRSEISGREATAYDRQSFENVVLSMAQKFRDHPSEAYLVRNVEPQQWITVWNFNDDVRDTAIREAASEALSDLLSVGKKSSTGHESTTISALTAGINASGTTAEMRSPPPQPASDLAQATNPLKPVEPGQWKELKALSNFERNEAFRQTANSAFSSGLIGIGQQGNPNNEPTSVADAETRFSFASSALTNRVTFTGHQTMSSTREPTPSATVPSSEAERAMRGAIEGLRLFEPRRA
ncbi:hypothetical protein QFC24_006882 [Naganishia onofrii]|uniref:Uncharacterized protein n=1 Tax=Naganishia onofrii TaxID=1851511 RepID=A0ACC2WX90_9TREE|nr:hypothetical protein QFC24_006882 [Naganishia onofrii]